MQLLRASRCTTYACSIVTGYTSVPRPERLVLVLSVAVLVLVIVLVIDSITFDYEYDYEYDYECVETTNVNPLKTTT